MITDNIQTLRLKSEPFEGSPEDLKNLIELLEMELLLSPIEGVGLSAIQISIPKKVSIIRSGGFKLDLYNAEIILKQQPFVFKQEGCLSVPGRFSDTRRFNLIEVKNGDGKVHKLSGFNAVICQHELDHWFGLLFTDVLKEKK